MSNIQDFPAIINLLDTQTHKVVLKEEFKPTDFESLLNKMRELISEAGEQQYIIVDFTLFEPSLLDFFPLQKQEKSLSNSSLVYLVFGLDSSRAMMLRYMQKAFNYDVYRVQDEQEALSKIVQLKAQNKLDSLVSQPSVISGIDKATIEINGGIYKKIHDKKWTYKHQTYFYEIDLIDYNVLISRPAGYIEYKDSLSANSLFDKVLGEVLNEGQSYYRIQDYTNVVNTSLGARKDFTQYIERNIDQIELLVFYGMNIYLKTVVHFGKLFNKKFVKVKVVNTYEEALSLVISHKYQNKNSLKNEDLKAVEGKNISSKEEIELLKKEIAYLKNSQKRNVKELFQDIGTVLWQDSLPTISEKVNREAPFDLLFNAIKMLKVDTEDLRISYIDQIEKLKKLNELQVHEITALKDKMRQSWQDNEEFLKKLNYDLRTPFQSVAMASSMLKWQKDPKKFENLVRVLTDNSSLLNEKLVQIQDVSEMKQEFESLNSKMFNLNKLIEKEIDIRYANFETKNLHGESDFDPKIPNYLIGDAEKIAKVIGFFLDNALAYTNIGGIIIRSVLEEDLDTQMQIRIEVEDTGIGMEQELQDKLMQNNSFYLNGNHAIGLFMCKQFVKLLGGTMGIESKKGVGSTFYVSLTLNRGVFSKEMNLINTHKKRRIASVKNQNQVIFLNNKLKELDLTTEFLLELNMNAEVVPDEEQCLFLLKQKKYHALFHYRS
ncbi:MAG: hypothetical protein B7C24_04840 [Bacteroidetes bacterium 4572_77]|nr:MAG: hypothetical protein B7C24_04840 [Bacteroidetes bacterium 4572_77]